MAYVLQDPDETLTHSVDWTPWLAVGDSIASGSWSIVPAAGPVVNDLGEVGAVISANVSGLVRGQVYRLTCDMVSAAGETGQQSIAIRCDHK